MTKNLLIKQFSLIPALCFLLPVFCCAQLDTVKIDVNVGMITVWEITASNVHTGDTIQAFKVTEDVLINSSSHKNFLVIKKGAPVLAVVDSSVLPRHTPGKKLRIRSDRPNKTYRPDRSRLSMGGEVCLRMIAVQAIDSTFLPLTDCTLRQRGGLFGGYYSDETEASIPAERQSHCNTKYPQAVLLLKK